MQTYAGDFLPARYIGRFGGHSNTFSPSTYTDALDCKNFEGSPKNEVVAKLGRSNHPLSTPRKRLSDGNMPKVPLKYDDAEIDDRAHLTCCLFCF